MIRGVDLFLGFDTRLFGGFGLLLVFGDLRVGLAAGFLDVDVGVAGALDRLFSASLSSSVVHSASSPSASVAAPIRICLLIARSFQTCS